MTTPSKPEAPLPELVATAEQNVAYSYNFATAKPDIGATERDHILGLCATINELKSALSARDEAGAVDTQAMVLDRALDALLRPHVSTAMQRTNAANYIRRRISELLATPPARALPDVHCPACNRLTPIKRSDSSKLYVSPCDHCTVYKWNVPAASGDHVAEIMPDWSLRWQVGHAALPGDKLYIRRLAAVAPTAASGDAETLARLFHDTYERLAPSFGYETRKDTRAFDPTSANGRLMIAVCTEIRRLAAVAPTVDRVDHALALASIDSLRTRLKSCEAALEERDAKILAAVAPAGMDGWIPVSERLPEEYGWYHCVVEGVGDLGMARWQEIVSLGHYADYGKRFSTFGGSRVTHWKPLGPLPTPPATAGKE